MPDFTPEQLKFIETCRKAEERCSDLRREAQRLNLRILAAEWWDIEAGLQAAISNQERAFRDGTLAEGSATGL